MQALSIFLIFFSLGCTSFGGPIAHLGYFRTAFVEKRGWLTEQQYADLVALCQIIPGPASSQVGIAIGYLKGGYFSAVMAWLGFTLPSVLLMILFAVGIHYWQGYGVEIWLASLKLFAVVVVAQAVWGMAKSFCRTSPAISIALGAFAILSYSAHIGMQFAVIIFAYLLGMCFLPAALPKTPTTFSSNSSYVWLWLVLFVGLLLGLPLISHSPLMQWIDIFYRTGSVVFGGGHVVLPILSSQVVPHFVAESTFLEGYAFAQMVPGPLFSFSAFLGQVSGGIGWAIVATLALFLPSFLLVFGVLPYWFKLAQNQHIRSGLNGVNAAVVGLLASALYQPIGKESLHSITDFILVATLFLLQLRRPIPLWATLALIIIVKTFFTLF